MIDISRLPRPEPSAGVEAYRAELAECLRLDARKQQNYQRYLAHKTGRHAGLKQASVSFLPVKLDIENVSRCNFACSMCAVSTWPKGKRAADMSLEAFKALIDEQHGLVEIKLNGLGEALMQGDDYFEMVRYARERRIWVRMTTNASLLHLRDNAQKLIDAGVNEIDISIDGSDAPTFQGIRIQSDFARVTENCKLLNAALRAAGKPSAKMWTLVQRTNYDRLHDHVPLAAALGFQHCVFSTQMHGWGNDSLAERNRSEMVGITENDVRDLLELGEVHGVRVAFWDVSEKFHTDHPSMLCPWPFERAVVTSDLRTVPCCMIGDPDAFEIAKGKTFLQAWQGDEYRDFRQAHLDGRIPEPCKGCYR
jgi:MoaA/NifB/PqqE/SkfB family radical SAM enzyme